MPSTKLEAFFEDFPLLTQYVNKASVYHVFVSRITPAVLSRNLSGRSYNSGDYFEVIEYESFEQVYLLDKDFNLVSTSYTTEETVRRKFLFWGPWITEPVRHTISGEVEFPNKVGDRLVKLQDKADQVAMLLSVCKGTLILYKSPKGLTLPEWVRQQIEKEKLILQQQIEEIENETV